MVKIDKFEGEYRFLSNFYLCPITYEGMDYPSTEHAYQAAKTTDRSARHRFVGCTSGQAKKFGKMLKLREDWEQVKLVIMAELVAQKFQIPELKKKLDETGHAELIEGNWWRDCFWGVCNGVGENHLGKILMMVRERNRKVQKMVPESVEMPDKLKKAVTAFRSLPTDYKDTFYGP